MRPPILFLTVAFGVGLWLGLDPFAFPGGGLWGAALPLAAASVWLAPRAPLGAAGGVIAGGGVFFGAGACSSYGGCACSIPCPAGGGHCAMHSPRRARSSLAPVRRS